MRFVAFAFALLCAVFVTPADAGLDIHIDKASQRMAVVEHGRLVHVFKVSTAAAGKRTPNGNFRPYLLRTVHRSSIYNNAPMPHAIFYSGNYAIHGTVAVGRLGNRASNGCVRLHPSNARALFYMVQRHGNANTRIMVRDGAPPAAVVAQMNGVGPTVVEHGTPNRALAAMGIPQNLQAVARAPRPAGETVASRTAAQRLVTASQRTPVGMGGMVALQMPDGAVVFVPSAQLRGMAMR